MTLRSQLLTEFPSFLSTISMVTDNRAQIVKNLIRAESHPPAIYEPARQLILSVLRGNFNFEQALLQAQHISDDAERDNGCDVLQTCQTFLINEPRSRISQLGTVQFELPNGMRLPITPIWLRHLSKDRLLVMHLWRTPLTPRQLRATGKILLDVMSDQLPRFAGCEIDFITTSKPGSSVRRRFHNYSWKTLNPLQDWELKKFLQELCEGWKEYQRKGPRSVMPRSKRDLFSL